MKKILAVLLLAASSWALSVSSSITTANVEQTLFLSDATYKMGSFVIIGNNEDAQIQVLYNHRVFIAASIPTGRTMPFIANSIAMDNADTISIKSTVAGVVATNVGTTAVLLAYFDWMAVLYDSRALTR